MAFRDVRTEIGASSTIMAGYLFAANVPIEKRVATALFYGIRTDIGDLGRHKADYDLEILARLFPLASQKLLARIETPRLPRNYFELLRRGLDEAQTYRDAVVTTFGRQCDPDIIAELSDYLLLRMEGMHWSSGLRAVHEKEASIFRSAPRSEKELPTPERSPMQALPARTAPAADTTTRPEAGSNSGNTRSAGGWTPRRRRGLPCPRAS